MDVEDILLNISQFLPCKQVAANRRVNKLWSKVYSSDIIWQQFFLLHFDLSAATTESESWFSKYASERIRIPEYDANAVTPEIQIEATTKAATRIENESNYTKKNVLAFKYFAKTQPSELTYRACVIATCLEIADQKFDFDATMYIGKDNLAEETRSDEEEEEKETEPESVTPVPGCRVPLSRVLYCTINDQLGKLYSPSEPSALSPLSTTLGISPVSLEKEFKAFVLYNHEDLKGEEAAPEVPHLTELYKYPPVMEFESCVVDEAHNGSFCPKFFNAGGYWIARHLFYCCWDQENSRILVIPHGETEFIY